MAEGWFTEEKLSSDAASLNSMQSLLSEMNSFSSPGLRLSNMGTISHVSNEAHEESPVPGPQAPLDLDEDLILDCKTVININLVSLF